jgi:hypothetical protein
MWRNVKIIGRNIFWGLLLILFLSNSGIPSLKTSEIVRVETRWMEFDYVTWTLETLWRKAAQISLDTHRYLNEEQQSAITFNYFDLINEQRQLRDVINNIYADPTIVNPQNQAEPYLERQRQVQEELRHIGYLYEAILQHQVSYVAKDKSLGFISQPVPPVQYHITSMPYALIVSPRDVIRQDADFSLLPDLTLDQIVALEKAVEEKLNVSALVVQIGGVGVYPTMVMETSSLTWLSEVVSHEWIHNFLTLRPLGMLYDQTPELRIINETTASIAGKELGNAVIEAFYPALLPPPVVESATVAEAIVDEPEEPQVFDFRAEMRETRVTVDSLLAEGKIDEAEAYMEDRRIIFVENGYNIRRLNQAYFAFHGAYADQPGGAAGEDPVGEAVRKLRAQSESLADFVRRIAWVTSYERLQQLVD